MNQTQQKRRRGTNKTPSDRSEVVRVTYTFPKATIDAMEKLRRKVAAGGDELLNRSEMVRVGLLALEGMSEARIRILVKALDRLKPGRRKQRVDLPRGGHMIKRS